jgi:ABC-type Fe3+ transport system permease subunit/DNA-binding beta-propeller fold protein YncE
MNWLLLKNSLLVSALTTLLAVSAGFVAALWLMALERRWRNRVLAAAVMALALPPFLVTNCWLHFLGGTGVWRSWLPLNIFSLGGTVWVLALLYWPIALLLVWSAWQRLEPAQLEADPAVCGSALVRGLLVPLARGPLVQASVLTFVLALNNFAVPAILQVKVFPAEIWVRFNTTFDTVGALQLSWPLVVGPLLLLIWLSRREIAWPRIQETVPAKTFRRQLGEGWLWFSGVVTALLLLLAVGLPLGQIAFVNRTWMELPGALAAGQSAVWNSFWYAALAATVIIAAALALSFRSSRRKEAPTDDQSLIANRRVGRMSLLTSAATVGCWLPFLVPGVLLGIGLIVVFNRPVLAAFYQSAGIVILAFAIRYFALGWSAVSHALRTTDPDLADAAKLDGATRWQLLRFVQWPQVAPQIAAAWYIVFLLCLWDVESMILVVPPGGETLALRIFNLLHYGHNAQVNALCLTLLGLAILPLAGWTAWQWLSKSRGVLRVAWATACAAFLLAGCGPKLSPTEAQVDSKLFSRVQIIGRRGVGVGELNKPRSVAVDAQDNLYVVDMTGRVQKFSPDGKFLLLWQMPQTDLGKPKGMCRDRDGNIVVIEPHYQRVNHYTPEGKLLARWGESGTNAGQFKMPRAAAVNSRGEILVSEYTGVERVQRFVVQRSEVGSQKSEVDGSPLTPSLSPSEGERVPPGREKGHRSLSPENPVEARLVSVFGQAGTGPGEFNRAEGLCVDAQDRIYVADSCNHRIQIFSSDGKFIRAFGRPGSGKGELSYPYDICVDRAGRIYVCEFGNSRIQIFDANCQPLEILGGPGTEPGKFNNPWGVALDSAGNLYVADSQNHRVQKLVRRSEGRGSRVEGQTGERDIASLRAPHSALRTSR